MTSANHDSGRPPLDHHVLNAAMASVTLLYFHLLSEGGITHNQTVYIDLELFDPKRYLNVELDEETRVDIDPSLLREGALIHLLCDLNDMIGDYEDDYLALPFTQGILTTLESCSWLPETVRAMLDLVTRPMTTLDDFQRFAGMLGDVYADLVVGRYRSLLDGPAA